MNESGPPRREQAPHPEPVGASMLPSDLLRGGGEAGALMRALAWSATPLGAPRAWPGPLRTLVEVMLAANQPMFVAWGPERTLLYNDPYIALLGRKHPHAMGRPFLDVWAEAEADLAPLLARVFAGEPVHMDDITLHLDRHGAREEAHFAFSYTPVRDEAGRVAGLFCACTETTERVLAERRRAADVARQRRLFDRAPGFMAILSGPEHRFEFANEAYARLVGDRALVGRTVREVFPDLEDQGFFALLDRVYRSGEGFAARDMPIRLRASEAAEPVEHLLDFVFEPVVDEAGSVTGIFVQGHDVTERARAEARLREREERLRLVVEGAKDHAIFTTDPGGTITSWSAGAEGAFGWTAREAVGSPAALIFTPEDRAQGADRRELATAATRGCANDERWHQRRDGSRVFMNGSVHPLPPDVEGRAQGFIKIARDETERRRTDEALRESEAFIRRVLESSGDCIKVLDLDARLEFMSAGGMCVMEVDDFGAVKGACWPDFWPHPDHEKALAAIAEARRGGTGRFQGHAPTAKGNPRIWDVTVSPILDAEGRPEKLLSISRDVTEQRRAEEASRETEARYQLAVRATNDAIWDWHLATDHVLWNESLQAAYGHRPDEVRPTGEWWIAQIHPDDRARVDASIHAAIDGAASRWSDEYRFRRADGSYAHVLDRGHVIRDAEGRAVRMIGAMLDLSERRRAEARLRASEDRLRLATEAAAVGTWDYDPVSGALAWDDRCRALFGLPPGRPVTYEGTFLAGLHPDDRARADAAVRSALDPAGPGTYDIEYRTIGLEDGAERWIAARGRAHVEGGRAVRFVGTVIDVTERKRTEAALREQTEELRAVLDAVPAAIWIARDPACGEIVGNRRSEELLRVRSGANMSTTGAEPASIPFRVLDAAGRELRPEELPVQRAARGEVVRDFEERVVFDDGAVVDLFGSAAPLYDAEGGVRGAIAAFVDVTERRRAEEQLREQKARQSEELQRLVSERTAELRQAEEQLRQAQKMEAVGQLTGGIAHDFNNLLTGVIGSLDMMQRRIAQGQTDRIERYANAAMTSANRAAALTHRLLAFSRRQPLDPKPVNANRLVTGMEELLRRTLGEAVRLEIVTAGGLWQTLCDPHQLESAILNLAINARDAMPAGGKLTIETCNAHLDTAYAAKSREVRPGQYICICVTDTGSGMSPDVVARAFDPFFTTKPIGQGTGLGLSMIYGFARQSEGYAKIYSEEGHGTTVKLYLPRYYGEAEDAEEAAARLTDAHRAEHGEVVLVVEDEAAVRDLVTDVLEELGYRAVEAADGPTGLKLLQTDMRVDLLVTDVGLPGLNGRQLADAAREFRPDLKVLFMTGYAENATIANGFLEPGMQMITKPFAVEALASRIRDMIEGVA